MITTASRPWTVTSWGCPERASRTTSLKRALAWPKGHVVRNGGVVVRCEAGRGSTFVILGLVESDQFSQIWTHLVRAAIQRRKLRGSLSTRCVSVVSVQGSNRRFPLRYLAKDATQEPSLVSGTRRLASRCRPASAIVPYPASVGGSRRLLVETGTRTKRLMSCRPKHPEPEVARVAQRQGTPHHSRKLDLQKGP